MSRSDVACRSCGRELGYLNPSDVLHVGAALRSVSSRSGSLWIGLVCPCGHEFSVRAHRIAVEVG